MINGLSQFRISTNISAFTSETVFVTEKD